MSFWDDETEHLAVQVRERLGEEAVAEAIVRATQSILRRTDGHPIIIGNVEGKGLSETDLKAAIKVELRALVRPTR